MRPRVRKWVFGVLAGLVVGYLVPVLLLGDGLARVPEARREFATMALAEANHLLSNPFERLMITRYRVLLVADFDGVSNAIVRAYTVYGVPYADVLVHEGGAMVIARGWW